MSKSSQLGILIAFLGGIITLIGLFPSVTGFEASPGVGILQILVILAGFSLLILGAFFYVQTTYYPKIKHNLAQQIAVRLSLTGLVIATAAGLADVLGFGSHPVGVEGQRPYFGIYQAAGLVFGFIVASAGVIIFALMGHSVPPDDSS